MGDLRDPTIGWPGCGGLCQRQSQPSPVIWLGRMVVTLDKPFLSLGLSFLSSRALWLRHSSVLKGRPRVFQPLSTLTPGPDGPHLLRWERPASPILASGHSLGVWKLLPRLTHFEL